MTIENEEVVKIRVACNYINANVSCNKRTMNITISSFKSKLTIGFYVGIAFFLAILVFTIRNLIKEDLTIGNFLFLNIIAFAICYGFAFRYSCNIHLDEQTFSVKYYFKDEKRLSFPTHEIIGFEKHADTVTRYYKKLLLITNKRTTLIKYNISDNSDEHMLKLLTLIVEKNKQTLTKIST